jgi:hypothetical protein
MAGRGVLSRLLRWLVPDATPGVGPVARIVGSASAGVVLVWPTMLAFGVAADWVDEPALALAWWQTALVVAPVAACQWAAREVHIRRQQPRSDRWREREGRRG